MVIDDISQIPSSEKAAIRLLKQDKKVEGWYSQTTEEPTVYLVSYNLDSVKRAEEVIIHEVVAHSGLRNLLGEKDFNKFLDKVWKGMTVEQKREQMEYIAQRKLSDTEYLKLLNSTNVRMAADEFVAHYAETVINKIIGREEAKSTWQKIKDILKAIIKGKGFNNAAEDDNFIDQLLKESYRKLREQGNQNANADVNNQFNEQLAELTEDNADTKIFSLGSPSLILRSAGVVDMPMKLYGNKIVKKAKKHGFDIANLRDLPKAVADPIAVFNNYQTDTNRSILTELKTKKGNFLVTLTVGKGGVDIDFNLVSSVFGKSQNGIVNWLNKGYATYINKEKTLGYLNLPAPITGALNNQELNSIAKIIKNFENPSISEKNIFSEEPRFSIVTDKQLLDKLESGEKQIGYRNVVLNEDGTLGSPMASKLGKRGEKSVATTPFEFGKWEQADENPELATDNGKINLIKPNGLGSVGGVDYNPYVHIRPTTLNKQFKNAWERPNLVYIETLYPTSELNGEYKADKAKLPTGRHDWNGGELILSRYDKPMRIVPWSEVADEWVKEFKDSGVHFDIVPPALLPLLQERGVEILPPHKGMGKDCLNAYADFKQGENKRTRFNVAQKEKSEGEQTKVTVSPQPIETAKIQKKFENPTISGKNNLSKEIRFSIASNPHLTEEAKAEMQSIKDKAIKNGTFMKAPNGKPTKLTEKQWLQVRTQAFKRWAGIWDLASKVVNISDVSELSFANNAAFMKYAKEHFQKGGKWKSYVNKDTGNKIHLSSTGINKSISNKAVDKSAVSRTDHLRALGKLDEILENSILGETHKDKNGQPNVPEIQLYYGAVTIDGNIYRIKTTVKKVRLNSGELSDRQYSFEVQEMELIEERPARQEIGDTKGVNSPTNSNNSISGANLLKNVEKSDGSGIKILDDHTQILDENGEPLVAYHGSNRKFNIFKYGDLGFHLGTLEQAEVAAEGQVRWNKKGRENIIAGFVNIRNPYRIEYDPETWNEPGSGFLRQLHDEKIIDDSDWYGLDYEGLSYKQMQSIREKLQAAGYDGVVYPNWYEFRPGEDYRTEFDDSYVAFTPNQIKSATDNNGEFSENNDIRFSIAQANDRASKTLRGQIETKGKAVYKAQQDLLNHIFDKFGIDIQLDVPDNGIRFSVVSAPRNTMPQRDRNKDREAWKKVFKKHGEKVYDRLHELQGGILATHPMELLEFMRKTIGSENDLLPIIENNHDWLIDKLRKAIGEENVITDNEEAQRIIDEHNGKEISDKERQDLTTTIHSSSEQSAKLQINTEMAKKKLQFLTNLYKGIKNSRGFIKAITTALGSNKTNKQSHYFEFKAKNGDVITLRVSNHNTNSERYKDNEQVVSIVVKSRRHPNTFIGNEKTDVKEYVYFKERIKDNTLSLIAESVRDLLETGEYQ